MYVYDETANLVNFMLIAHMLWKISMKSILVTNIKWEKPTAHATCSYVISALVNRHLGQSGDVYL